MFDADSCNYVFNYEVSSSTQITYGAQITYNNANYPTLTLAGLEGGIPPYDISITTSFSQYEYEVTSSSTYITFSLDAETLYPGTCSFNIIDTLGCTTPQQDIEIFGRVWEVTGSFCEDGTGSVSQRNLNFYTNEETGSEWVTVKIRSGSESPIELATSSSLTGSLSWNSNDTLYIDIFTGSNDNFYLRREFSGSNSEETGPANITGSEISSSAIILGNSNMVHFGENLDVSLAFGPDYNIKSLHLTASKVNTENLSTNINFKFDRQVPLSKIRDNFTGSVATLITTGSDGSGSNFIARNNEYIDIEYGNTGSFIGQNKLLFRDTYAFGNIINTISGSSVEYTSGSIFNGSVSASIFGGENAYYFTQRTDKAWLMVADVDNIEFLEAYSYTDADQYANDPIGVRTNTTYVHREYKIFAASQRMENDLMYIMIMHEDEYAQMPLPTGLGGGEVFSRKLQNLKDVNRIYYLFMSPIGSSDSQADLDSRAISIGQYFIDNIIYG